MREPVLDRRVDVAQLWRLACDAARKGEKWGQRKKSVSDAMQAYYTQSHRDRRAAEQWVAEVVDPLGFFDPSADWHAVEAGLQMLDQADGDVTDVAAAAVGDRAGLLDEEFSVQEWVAPPARRGRTQPKHRPQPVRFSRCASCLRRPGRVLQTVAPQTEIPPLPFVVALESTCSPAGSPM